MDKSAFYDQLAQILDAEEVKGEDKLADFDSWDSLAILSVLAMTDAQYGVSIKAEEIRSVVRAADLASLVETKQK